VSDLFREKASDWDRRPFPMQISDGVSAAIHARVSLSPTLRVLDFGAGTGLILSKLAPYVGRLLAVDVSPAMLEQLAAKPEIAGKVDVYCQDITREPLAQRVDLIVSAMAMHHVDDTAALARALFAHLVPGGRVALADLDTEDGTFHPANTDGVFHHGFDRARLGQLLADAGFVDVEFGTACEVDKEQRRYPIFLVTARRPS
jgi:SAM-dependent methyltransferase